jgi:RNA polymerase sigma-70 factor (ECF subfamily)
MRRVFYVVRFAVPPSPRPTHPQTRALVEARRFGTGRLDLQKHRDRLLRAACQLCGNETEAQDLVQETLLQALKSVHRFRGESTVHTWLHGILLNLFHRHTCRQAQKKLVFDEELALSGTVQPSSTLALDQDYCADKVAEAVERLSPKHREVVMLRYYEGLKIHEIAERTGVSNGTVKSRLHYAIRCLEQYIPSGLNLFVSAGTQSKR